VAHLSQHRKGDNRLGSPRTNIDIILSNGQVVEISQLAGQITFLRPITANLIQLAKTSIIDPCTRLVTKNSASVTDLGVTCSYWDVKAKNPPPRIYLPEPLSPSDPPMHVSLDVAFLCADLSPVACCFVSRSSV
jgi:hypothetical protein